MNSQSGHVLLSVEAEAYIEALEEFNLKDIGNVRWGRQHEMVEKLNMQAVISASSQEDEFIKEYLISYNKISVLIHDVIVTEVWKQKIFPELLHMKFEPKITFPLYIVLYHEATVANLLETVLYHQGMCEAADDHALDLLDYCYRKLTQATSGESEEDSEAENESLSANMKDLCKQRRQLEFDICVKAMSILRYITDCLDSLPLSVTTRLLNTLDIPVLLVQLVENPPWTKRERGKISKYIDNKWEELSVPDSFKITKVEGQVWIALYHLLMDQQCQQKYELDSYRKNLILKVRSYLTEVLLDQMPILGELRRYLEHLSMMEPPAAKQTLILEQVPEIQEKILMENKGQWKKIAKKQSKSHFSPKDSDLRDQAKRWADTYNMDVLENLLPDAPKCATCGEPASKRCSRCQNEWYCRRECQVTHWKKHKQACNLLVDSLQKIKLQEENKAS